MWRMLVTYMSGPIWATMSQYEAIWTQMDILYMTYVACCVLYVWGFLAQANIVDLKMSSSDHSVSMAAIREFTRLREVGLPTRLRLSNNLDEFKYKDVWYLKIELLEVLTGKVMEFIAIYENWPGSQDSVTKSGPPVCLIGSVLSRQCVSFLSQPIWIEDLPSCQQILRKMLI